MKSAKEIKAYRDDLKRLGELSNQCRCILCKASRTQYSMLQCVLTWVLGEGTPEMERAVEEVAAEVRR